jgi:hypothetical protein
MATATVSLFDAEAVLAVEDVGQQEAAEPAQLAIRLNGANRRFERRRPRSWRLDLHLELRAHLDFAADTTDERIPLRVGSEVGHNRPHALRWRIDVDLTSELSHSRQSLR